MKKIENCGNLVGSVSIKMDTEIGEVTLHGIKVLETSRGYMLAAHYYKGSDGKYYSHYYAKDMSERKGEVIKEVGIKEKQKW